MRKAGGSPMEYNNYSDIDRIEIEAEKKRREAIIKKNELKRNTILFTIASCIVPARRAPISRGRHSFSL